MPPLERTKSSGKYLRSFWSLFTWTFVAPETDQQCFNTKSCLRSPRLNCRDLFKYVKTIVNGISAQSLWGKAVPRTYLGL